MIPGEHDLPVTVAPIFPLALARVHVETNKNPFIKTIDVTIMKNRAIELVLHILVLPDGRRSVRVATALHFNQRRAFSITRRNEETIPIDHDGLRDVDAVVSIPFVTPEQGAILRREAHHTK